LAVLAFKLRASCLLGWCSTTWTTPQNFYFLIGSCIFAQGQHQTVIFLPTASHTVEIKLCTTHLAYQLSLGLTNFLFRLTSIWDPPNLYHLIVTEITSTSYHTSLTSCFIKVIFTDKGLKLLFKIHSLKKDIMKPMRIYAYKRVS
jgi:hypothetical protein